MKRKRVLFICVHNSARSQMAAAFLNQLCGEEFEAESAGLEPGNLNPLVVDAMREIGLDISHNKTQRAFDLWKSGRIFEYVITVCSEAEAEGCPIFPGITKRLHWSFPDPARFQGSDAEKAERTRQVRDAIRRNVEEWCGSTRVEPA